MGGWVRGGELLKITYIKIIREGGLKAHPRLTKLEVIVGVKLAYFEPRPAKLYTISHKVR